MTSDIGINEVLDPDQWLRQGPGKVVESDLLPMEVASLLEGCAQGDASWRLISVQMVRCGSAFQERAETIAFRDLPASVSEGFWQYFLWVPALSPWIAQRGDLHLTIPLLSTNGLVNIQCGRRSRIGAAKTLFGLVDRVRNRRTGESVRHVGYGNIFNRLRAATADANSKPRHLS